MAGNETEEVAKAVQEVAKTTNTLLDKASELGGFFCRIFGKPLEDIAEVVGYHTEYWKIKNILKLKEKYEIELSRRGLSDIKDIPFRIGVPLLQGASCEDDDEIQSLWAGLLVSEKDTSFDNFGMSKSFISVLGELSPHDAKALDILSSVYVQAELDKASSGERNEGKIRNSFVKIDDVYKLELEHSLMKMMRLGIICLHDNDKSKNDDVIVTIRYAVKKSDKQEVEFKYKFHYSFTVFGALFVRACKGSWWPGAPDLLPIESEKIFRKDV